MLLLFHQKIIQLFKIFRRIVFSNKFLRRDDISELEFSEDGLTIGIGNETGKSLFYDIRYPIPLHTIQNPYQKPIKKINFHSYSDKIIISDTKIIKIFNNMLKHGELESTNSLFTFIEPLADINDIAISKDCGIIFTALESSKLGTFFIPHLGPAPKWCTFLENITEELEETVNDTVQENFKFLTKKQLEEYAFLTFIYFQVKSFSFNRYKNA